MPHPNFPIVCSSQGFHVLAYRDNQAALSMHVAMNMCISAQFAHGTFFALEEGTKSKFITLTNFNFFLSHDNEF
jgi:hypothetical protein